MIKLDRLFKRFDKILCLYFGIKQNVVRPIKAKMIKNKLIISNTESNRRHLYRNTFDTIKFEEINTEDRKKLGVAVGELLAKNLVISFENSTIKDN